MLSKKLVVILVLTTLLVVTQVADVVAGSVDRKMEKAPRKDENADEDNKDTDVRKTIGHSDYQYY